MAEIHYLTADGLRRLQEELEYLKGPAREELSKRLRFAIQQGDLSENADYIQAKEEQGFLEGRILELTQILNNYVLIEENNNHKDVVNLGAKVTIQEEGFEPETYQVVGPKEADPKKNRISHESPIGKALIGRGVGEVVTAETPTGKITFKILSIE
ncbi:transcription elongation factor GreA [Anaerolinea thermophila]|uniref:Transcription elongation factor GreA n=1 Tax=Anaerolinea thermophila (strain DSM 14523 / JCM 11388 / NBRC 100420 / UNI-1) TaxID=926569 RepID=E8N5A9_ANATU|nr:transcription elongation factor GreA [Anaerolinea thermophila]BAJ63623.1 transcription elongation factor GreA [Anaerolinea thermophila UNI-1]